MTPSSWSHYHLPAQTGRGLVLNRGQRLRVIDPEGEQVADLVSVARRDPEEWLSSGHTFDYNGTIYLTRGHVLYSDRSNPMWTIVEDQVGRHDFLYAACSLEMFRTQYGIREPHPNCLENLTQALVDSGVRPRRIPTPFNIFMNVDVLPDGTLQIHPPRSKPGDAIVLRAEMDMIVAVSACAASGCSGGRCTPIDVEILT